MKTKYKLIDLHPIDEKQLTNYLQKQAANGWMLEKIGIFFLKFKKTKPQELRFFIDYHRPTSSYIHALEKQGYHFIDYFRIINIFYSDNMDISAIDHDANIADRKKTLYPLVSIISFMLIGLVLFFLCDIFGLSAYMFISTNHMILYLNDLIGYLLLKCMSIFLIWEGCLFALLRFQCHRESQNQKIPHALLVVVTIISRLLNIIMIVSGIITMLIYSIEQPIFLISFIAFLILFYGYSYFINKKIIKSENKAKRTILTIVALIICAIIYQNIPSLLPDEDRMIPSNDYQNAAYNYQRTSQTLLYDHQTYYGNDNEKNEFDEYIDSYCYDIYYCINQDIAKKIFSALVINTDHQRRIPDWPEIDAITEEKGSFDSLKDVPFYSYQKSASHLKSYNDLPYDLCYGYDNRYLILQDHIVLDLQLKDNLDLEKLVTYYLNQ